MPGNDDISKISSLPASSITSATVSVMKEVMMDPLYPDRAEIMIQKYFFVVMSISCGDCIADIAGNTDGDIKPKKQNPPIQAIGIFCFSTG